MHCQCVTALPWLIVGLEKRLPSFQLWPLTVLGFNIFSQGLLGVALSLNTLVDAPLPISDKGRIPVRIIASRANSW